MVKAIISTLAAIILSVAFFVWTDSYLKGQFGEVTVALEQLHKKIEDESATMEDARAVKNLWADKKRKLHVFVPHGDISYVDYWLNEACALLYKDNFNLALGKIEVLIEIIKNLPAAYGVEFENVF